MTSVYKYWTDRRGHTHHRVWRTDNPIVARQAHDDHVGGGGSHPPVNLGAFYEGREACENGIAATQSPYRDHVLMRGTPEGEVRYVAYISWLAGWKREFGRIQARGYAKTRVGEYTVPLIGIPREATEEACAGCGKTKDIDDLVLDGDRFLCKECL